jgi:hypothetical protein
VDLPAIRLGISLEPMDSTAERLANIRDAVKVGFDIVHVIGDRGDSAVILSADHTTDASERAGYTALEASYELLRLAGQQRSLVAIGPLSGTEEEVAAQAMSARSKLDDLIPQVDFAFSFLQTSIDDPADLSVVRRIMPDMPETQMRSLATVLAGSVASATRRIRRLREDLGISYFTFHKSPATSWNTLAMLVAAIDDRRPMTDPVIYGGFSSPN